jgi:hypothetical protein
MREVRCIELIKKSQIYEYTYPTVLPYPTLPYSFRACDCTEFAILPNTQAFAESPGIYENAVLTISSLTYTLGLGSS